MALIYHPCDPQDLGSVLEVKAFISVNRIVGLRGEVEGSDALITGVVALFTLRQGGRAECTHVYLSGRGRPKAGG